MALTTSSDIERAITRFKVADVKSFVFSAFPEITWHEVKKFIVKEKILLTSKSIAKIIANAVSKLSENDKKKRIGTLKLIETSLYPSKRTWTCFELIRHDSVHKVNETEEIERTIGQVFRIAGLSVIRQVICYGEIYWIMIIVKKIVKGRGIVLQQPKIFAFSSNEPYLFTASKNNSMDVLQALTKALNYEFIKNACLDGRHIHELLRLLKRKELQDTDGANAFQLSTETYRPGANRTRDGKNIAVSRSENKRKYGENIFGVNPPKLEKLIIEAPNCPCQDPLMEGKTVDITVRITAPNVFEYLTQLIEADVMETPLPRYLENVANSAKNKIKLKSKSGGRRSETTTNV